MKEAIVGALVNLLALAALAFLCGCTTVTLPDGTRYTSVGGKKSAQRVEFIKEGDGYRITLDRYTNAQDEALQQLLAAMTALGSAAAALAK